MYDIIINYQKYVKEGASPAYNKQLAVIGLAGEVGELAEIIKKEQIYPIKELQEKYPKGIKEKITDEAGDVLWQLINLLNQYDLDVEDVIEYNINKLNNRHGGAGRTAPDGGKRAS